MVLDEGAATCIMSYSCWQDLGYPTLATSKTVLKAFDGHLFTPHGILATFPIELGGKTIIVEVEIVNAPLDYNLLLGHSWFYPMKVALQSFIDWFVFLMRGRSFPSINWIIALPIYSLNLLPMFHWLANLIRSLNSSGKVCLNIPV